MYYPIPTCVCTFMCNVCKVYVCACVCTCIILLCIHSSIECMQIVQVDLQSGTIESTPLTITVTFTPKYDHSTCNVL